MSEPGSSVHAEDSPSWAEVVHRAEHGDTVREHVDRQPPGPVGEHDTAGILVFSFDDLVRIRGVGTT